MFCQLIDFRLIISTGIPALVVIIGWFWVHKLNARREVDNKRRELQLKGLEKTFMRLTMLAHREWTDELRREFEEFVAEIQLYGTPKQVTLMTDIVNAFIRQEPKIKFDFLLEDLRDHLRKELRMPPIEGRIWWYRFQLPLWAQKKTEPSKEE